MSIVLTYINAEISAVRKMPIVTFCKWNRGTQMALFAKLFSSTIGLLSLFTIAFVIVMAIFLFFWVGKKAQEDAKNAGQQ